MRISAALTGLSLVAAALIGCTSTPDTASQSNPPATQQTAACKKHQEVNPSVSAAPTQETVNTLKPTDVCDHTINVEVKDNRTTVACAPSVGQVELKLPNAGDKTSVKGFVGDWLVHRYTDFTRVEWDTLGAHAVVVNDSQWAYVDGPGSNVTRTTPMALASLLNTSDWGQIVKVVACDRESLLVGGVLNFTLNNLNA